MWLVKCWDKQTDQLVSQSVARTDKEASKMQRDAAAGTYVTLEWRKQT